MMRILFSEFLHPELIKRAADFIRILILADSFTQDDATLLLTCFASTSHL